jgi:hypothetical protein
VVLAGTLSGTVHSYTPAEAGGVCGPANGRTYEQAAFSSLTGADLCAGGSSAQLPTLPGNWTCTGNGTVAPCSAYLTASVLVPSGGTVSLPLTDGVSLTVASVTFPGTVTATTTAGPGAKVTLANGSGFKTVPGTSYEITSSAVTGGMTTVCIAYNPANVSVAENLLRLLHHNGSAWEDITTSVDTANNKVCGQTATLSPFVIGYRTVVKPGDCDGDGKVSIAEVQSAINMYLGLKGAEACVNTDGTVGVGIAEVQKVINGYLGL